MWWLVWAGWYTFGQYIGVKFDNKVLKLFIDFVTNISFIIPYEGIAFVSETPKRISWKDKRLHNEKGAAVEYENDPDNFKIYMLNGVRVSKNIALGKITKKDFLKEENAEVRRVMIERLGPDAILKLGAKKIDTFKKSGKDYHNYILYSLPLAKNDPDKEAKYLYMKDVSTDRKYYIPVAPELTSAKNALLWYLNIEDYHFDYES